MKDLICSGSEIQEANSILIHTRESNKSTQHLLSTYRQSCSFYYLFICLDTYTLLGFPVDTQSGLQFSSPFCIITIITL